MSLSSPSGGVQKSRSEIKKLEATRQKLLAKLNKTEHALTEERTSYINKTIPLTKKEREALKKEYDTCEANFKKSIKTLEEELEEKKNDLTIRLAMSLTSEERDKLVTLWSNYIEEAKDFEMDCMNDGILSQRYFVVPHIAKCEDCPDYVRKLTEFECLDLPFDPDECKELLQKAGLTMMVEAYHYHDGDKHWEEYRV